VIVTLAVLSVREELGKKVYCVWRGVTQAQH
jgi:hypothetical protein